MLKYEFTNGRNTDFINLCSLLDNHLNESVGGEKQREQYNQYNSLELIHDVVLAYEDEIPVGCAAFKYYENGVAEVKRVFVKEEYRGKGIARKLMHYIEECAKKKGYVKLILETGLSLKAAHSLYYSLSFQKIPNYGQYANLKDSLCMEKNLAQTKKDWSKLDTLIYVGTYTNWNELEMKEELLQMGKGIHILRIDREQKRLVYENVVTGIENPSFLTVDKKNHMLYAVNELQEYEGEAAGSVGAYSIDSVTGNLTSLNKRSTGGKDPCHVVLSDDERFVIVTNYTSGSVCVFEVKEDGLGERTALVKHQGSSINKQRQNEAHAHSSINIKEKSYIIVMDLGMDQLLVYEINENGSLTLCQTSTYHCDKGSGPRHAVFHPSMKYLYVINELSSTISILKVNLEKLNFDSIQTISTLPKECECSNTAADIHVSKDGRFLYASNRGHDSIAVYEINQKDGTLQILQYVPCGGKTPRNFMIDSENEFLIVANQDSNEIVMFEMQKESGLLTEVDKIEVPKPVCLCQVKLNNTRGK